ncbi:MAG: hypothetical protein U0R51_12200 [Solirubrobacterales bacterium]
MSAADRALARTVSGPIGRGLAFALDLAAVLARVVGRRPPGPPSR